MRLFIALAFATITLVVGSTASHALANMQWRYPFKNALGCAALAYGWSKESRQCN